MKRIIMSIVHLVAVAVAGVSCLQLEQPGLNENLSGNDSGTVQTVRVRMEGGATKVDISGATGAASWTTGDQVAYCITNGSTTQYNVSTVDVASSEISLTIPDGYHRANYAIYPASVRGSDMTTPTVVYPTSYDLAGVSAETFAPCPMVAINTASDMDFYHVGGLLRIAVDNVPSNTRSIVVEFHGVANITGTYSVSNAGTPSAAAVLSSGTGNVVTFTNGSADFPSSTWLNIPVPSVDLSSLGSIFIIFKDSSGNFKSAMGKPSGWSGAVRAKGRTASYSSSDSKAVFSVSSMMHVEFSPGNLKAHIASGPTDSYNYAADSWDFHTNQWDWCNQTLAVGNTVDHFGWVGSSATWDMYGLSTYTSLEDQYYGYSGSDALMTDWGSIPGVIAACGKGWFTLDVDQFGYLFNTRSTGATVNGVPDARFTGASIRTDVSAVNGIILFPDGYAGGTPSGVTWGTVNPAAGSGSFYFNTTCTAAGWDSLEAAGCIFLPASGYRGGSGLGYVGSRGFYWSRTASGTQRARSLVFWSGSVYPQGNFRRYYGFAVRLVR